MWIRCMTYSRDAGLLVGFEALELGDWARVDLQRGDSRAVLTRAVPLVPVGAVVRPRDEQAAPGRDDRHVIVTGGHDRDLLIVLHVGDHRAQLTDCHRPRLRHGVPLSLRSRPDEAKVARLR